ncbi:MAG: glycosyltransferase family 4 protein [Candidatus Hydrogenedentes bacterium]|nr:glycosyltransferase family 4 protein [Candidatus Hydrogenedentota bacterium]
MLLDMFIVDSHFMREELTGNGFPSEKIHVVPHIVRLPECTPEPVPQEPNILYVGQLIRGKGVDLLLRALSAVKCEFKARIVGTGNARPKLEALAQQLHLSEKVSFEGWVAHDQLDSYYSWAKVVAVPSRWAEPYGMVGLEAMNHARATVGFRVGGIPDWLVDGENGILVDPQDTKAYARALEKILLDTDLAVKMGAAARVRVLREFSFDSYLDEVEGLLGQCLSQLHGYTP